MSSGSCNYSYYLAERFTNMGQIYDFLDLNVNFRVKIIILVDTTKEAVTQTLIFA